MDTSPKGCDGTPVDETFRRHRLKEKHWDAIDSHWINAQYDTLSPAQRCTHLRVRFENAPHGAAHNTSAVRNDNDPDPHTSIVNTVNNDLHNRHTVTEGNTNDDRQRDEDTAADGSDAKEPPTNDKPTDASPDHQRHATSTGINRNEHPDELSNGQHHDGDTDTSKDEPTYNDAYVHGFDDGLGYGTAYATGYDDGFSAGHDAPLVSDNSDHEDNTDDDSNGDY